MRSSGQAGDVPARALLRDHSLAGGAAEQATAARNVFTPVLMPLRTLRFRALRLTAWRARFFADLC